MSPAEIANSTGAEIMQRWDGYKWRAQEATAPLAMQSYLTLSMFSKDLTLEHVLTMFGIDTDDVDADEET